MKQRAHNVPRALRAEDALVKHVMDFQRELGAGLAFVGWQVPLEVGGDGCFIELKAGQFKREQRAKRTEQALKSRLVAGFSSTGLAYFW